MLDTIVLTLSQSSYAIVNHDRFEPSTKTLFDESIRLGGRGYLVHKQNPTRSELKDGIYKPRLSVTKRFNDGLFERPLKIEFSIPKLLFGNNFDEVRESDFEKVITQLKASLERMGVMVYEDKLINAPVSAIHYSKNIPLTNGLTPLLILKEIRKANITQRLDFNQSDFRNEGHLVKWHANSYEIAIYDKIKDLNQSKKSDKRAFEKDNAMQMNIFEDVGFIRKTNPFEVIRIEIRLNQRQKIRQIIKVLDYKIEPTFKELFSKEIAKKVLLHFLNEIENQYPNYNCNGITNTEFISQFIVDNPKVNIKEVICAFGYCKFLEDDGIRDLNKLLQGKFSRKTCDRLTIKMNSYILPDNSFNIFKPLRENISKFESLKLVDFEANMLNNDKYE